MKKKYRVLKIILTIGILVFLLSFSLNRFSNRLLGRVEVTMKQKEPVFFVDEEKIREMVKKANPSKKIGDLDIPALEREILAMPVVDSANVYLKLNGELNLNIVQKIPVFRLEKLGKIFYVDEKGMEFPLSKNYSHPCMLISGIVLNEEYPKVIDLVKKIDSDEFSRNFFIGIRKVGQDYFLMTSDGNYKVEFGGLENIDFKIRGFRTFVEKYLIYQAPDKYSKISLKYENQIVTTLRKEIEETEKNYEMVGIRQ